MSKLLLINPAPKDEIIYSKAILNLPPLTLGYVAGLTPENWDIKILDENVEPYEYEDADLVALTSLTYNAPRAYELAEHFRERGIPTIMGGIHASMLPKEASKHVNHIVIGEVENIWKNIIEDFEKDQLKSRYIGTRDSLQNLIIPRRDLFLDRYQPLGMLQTARGCPMGCDFCSVTTFNGGAFRQRPIEEVLDELEKIEHKVVFFVDDNILGHGEAAERRAIQLFKGITERGIKIRWASQASINFTNNVEVLKYAQKSGCFMLIIGFESINREVLKNMNKVENLRTSTKKYPEVIKKFQDYGICVMGAFIFGNDCDKKDVFEKTWRFIIDSKIDCSQFSILCPFPGTKLYERLKTENRLIYKNYPNDWSYYNVAARNVVFEPKHMTPIELLDGTEQTYKATTSLTTSAKRAFDTLFRTKKIQNSIFSYNWNRNFGKIVTKEHLASNLYR